MIELLFDNETGLLTFRCLRKREVGTLRSDPILWPVGVFWRGGAQAVRRLAAGEARASFAGWADSEHRVAIFKNTEQLRSAIRNWSGGFRNIDVIALGVTHDHRRATLPAAD